MVCNDLSSPDMAILETDLINMVAFPHKDWSKQMTGFKQILSDFMNPCQPPVDVQKEARIATGYQYCFIGVLRQLTCGIDSIVCY